jgi:transcription antitermination protein NusB
MRPRTFARAIAFQVLYREDLNPRENRVVQDALLEQGRVSRELQDFVSHLAEAHEHEDSAQQKGEESDATMYRQWLRTPGLIQFTRSLVMGVLETRKKLDERIGQVAANWSLDRMAATDRNLLRMGAYEILNTETPDKTAVDEAVELAKRFGGANSAQFVNGILDKLMHTKGGMANDESQMTKE